MSSSRVDFWPKRIMLIQVLWGALPTALWTTYHGYIGTRIGQ